MTSNMFLERLEDLSVYYLIKDLFNATPGITIVDDYPVTDLVIPSIAINAGKLRLEGFELGNRDELRARKWYIDVYAKNKAQRDDFGYKILNAFKDGINIYDYNQGFPPASGIPIIEHMDVPSKELDPIRIDPNLVDKMYYRVTITIGAVNDTV